VRENEAGFYQTLLFTDRGYIKYHHVGKKIINNKEQLRDIVFRQLRRLQKLPDLLKSFFGHPDLAYVSE